MDRLSVKNIYKYTKWTDQLYVKLAVRMMGHWRSTTFLIFPFRWGHYATSSSPNCSSADFHVYCVICFCWDNFYPQFTVTCFYFSDMSMVHTYLVHLLFTQIIFLYKWSIFLHLIIYIYIYICKPSCCLLWTAFDILYSSILRLVSIYVCACSFYFIHSLQTHKHTHTHIYIYIYIGH